MKYLIYFLYHPQGKVDAYVPHFLNALRARFDVIHVVFNGQLHPEARASLAMADRIQERPNDEFDVGAYKAALFSNPDDFYAGVDELTLANFTFFAPLGDFEAVFDWSAGQTEADFWGLSAHQAMTPNPFTGEGTLPYHLNSHWITLRNPLLRRPEFMAYWRALPPIRSYIDSVLLHESQFTRHFEGLGHRHAVYLDDSRLPSDYPAFNDVDAAVAQGFPILKRRLFYHTPTTYMDRYDVDLRGALERIGKDRLYDTDLIWDSVAGAVDPGVLYRNADLLRIVPDGSWAVQRGDEEAAPVKMILMVSGRLDAAQIETVLSRIVFDCDLTLVGDSADTLETMAETARARPGILRCDSLPGEDLVTGFGAVERICSAGDTVPLLFASVDRGGIAAFEYGMRHLARDAQVAILARRALSESRFFGLALPAPRTYGIDAETDLLNDEARLEMQFDLSGFDLRATLDGPVLHSTAGAFWIRPDLLARAAAEIGRFAGQSPAFFADALPTAEAQTRLSRSGTDGKEIETFLSLGLPQFAAGQRYVTLLVSNTAEMPRNFVKLEARYRDLSERLGVRDPFLMKARLDYLLQFNSQEGREAVFSEIHTRAFNAGWQAARQQTPAAPAPPPPPPPAPEPEKDETPISPEAWRSAFDHGYQDGWKAAFDQGFQDGWQKAASDEGGRAATGLLAATRRLGRTLRRSGRN